MISLDEKIPLYSIFILFLIITASFITELFPCKVRKVLSNNIFIKHFFAFLTMVFFVVLTSPIKGNNIFKIIINSILVYIMFVFTIKTHYKFFITIIILLGLLYILIIRKVEIKDMMNDEKNELEKDKLTNNYNILTIINNIIFIVVIILIIIGFLVYYGEKKHEYKKDFNIIIFLFGKPNCNYTDSNISIINSLKYAIK